MVTPIDDNIPLGNPEVDVEDDPVPQGTVSGTNDGSGRLPQTGESSPLPIYLTGAGLILGGFILSRVFRRTRKQD